MSKNENLDFNLQNGEKISLQTKAIKERKI